MRKIRLILGVFLIVTAIGGLFLWEWKGREVLLMDEVLVAREEIPKGTVIEESMFLTRGIAKSDILKGALRPGEAGLLRGKTTSQLIAENGQVIMEYFRENDFLLKENESIFVIDPGWIAMRSSALRRGDLVEIYGSDGSGPLGSYRVAYVKDASQREVRNAETGAAAGHGEGILARPDSTSVIDHIEIISTFLEYERIAGFVSGSGGTTPASLVIVQVAEN